MIALQSIRNTYAAYEISKVGFIRGPRNPADGLTKIWNSSILYHMLSNGKADFDVQ